MVGLVLVSCGEFLGGDLCSVVGVEVLGGVGCYLVCAVWCIFFLVFHGFHEELELGKLVLPLPGLGLFSILEEGGFFLVAFGSFFDCPPVLGLV